jgi:heme exporter protein A
VSALLRFDDVSLRRGGRLLFEGLELALAPGDALQVAGPNGAGKSSLIRLAAGLLQHDGGAVERSPSALADDNLALDAELPLERAMRFWVADPEPALTAMGICHLAAVPVRLLSSGQGRRAALARVAGSAHPLWLLDEPLNALDLEGAECLGRIVAAHRARGGAVVAASHQPLPGDWGVLELGA